jgi:hypothetical protein
MNKKLFLSGILGVALVFAIAVISCNNDDGDEEKNTDPKTLVITNFSGEFYSDGLEGVYIGIVPVGTTYEQFQSNTVGAVAGGNSETGQVTLSGSTCTAQLYTVSNSGDLTKNKWTGSGTYDVFITLIIEEDNTSYIIYYRKQKVSFTSASTSVKATDFTEVDFNEGANTEPKTLEITNISKELRAQAPNGICILLAETGRTPESVLRKGRFYHAYAMGGSEVDATFSALAPYTYTTDLYVYDDEDNNLTSNKWRDHGDFDVYLVLYDGDDTHYYRKRNVSFTSTSTSVNATTFVKVEVPKEDEQNNENTDSKTLRITNISQELAEQGQDGIQIAVVPVGTTLAQLWSLEVGITAWADSKSDSVTLSGSTCTAQLYVYDDSDYPTNRWTDSGNYDVFIVLYNWDDDYIHYYRKQNVSFTSASTSVNVTTFVEVYPPQ